MIERNQNDYKNPELENDSDDYINPLLLKLYCNCDYQKEIVDLEKIKDRDFSGFYTIFLKLAWSWFKHQYPESMHWGNHLKGDFLCGLLDQIEPVAIKCLITEIHYCKENGFLCGDNSSEEYHYFNEHYFQNQENLIDFLGAYPLLEKIILETITVYSENIIEIMHRLKEDKKKINNNFFKGKASFKSVISFKQLGDLHLYGKCVFCLLFDNGEKIIYKPNCIKYMSIYYHFINLLYQKQGLQLKNIKLLDSSDYGWIEYVTQLPCKSEDEVSRYYRRLGINLFFCYLMGNTDIHFENIIAHGEFPIIIDLEAFVCDKKMNVNITADERAQQFLHNSVLNIGILPFFFENKMGRGVNLSGIEANEQKLPYLLPIIAYRKTSDIKVEYRRPVVRMAENTPRLNGEYILAGDYVEDLIKGFAAAYLQGIKGRQLLLGILKKEIEGINCRYILKSTQQYQMLLNTSYWPDLMADEKKRYMHIIKIYDSQARNNNDEQIMFSETKSILKGDIPYFWFKPYDTCLYLPGGGKIEKYFNHTLAEQLENKMGGLSETDCSQQILFIKQTMALLQKSNLKNDYTLPSILEQPLEFRSKTIFLDAAIHLGDIIIKNAIHGDNGDVSWITPRLHMSNEMEWHMEPANIYMYNGISGISVFFHALFYSCGYKRFQNILELLDTTMEEYTNRVYDNRKYLQSEMTGALNGEGSIVYAYQLIYKLTKKRKYITLAEKHIKVVEDLVKRCKCPDLISGNAGAILVYINMFKITNDNKYKDKALLIADELIMSAKSQEMGGLAWNIEGVSLALTGFSHGNAGIIYALSKLFIECNLEKYKYVIEEAIKYEDLLFDEKIGNWIDLREEDTNELDSVSWCHGAAGILISRLEALRLNNRSCSLQEVIKVDINKATNKILSMPLRNGLCLCHGNCGNINIIKRYLKYDYRTDLDDKIIGYLKRTAHNICCDQIMYLPQEENPGLMNGFSGIGYLLLKELYSLPDILAIEI